MPAIDHSDVCSRSYGSLVRGYDSVVVFDRIREPWSADRSTPFAEVANRAALQTVPRTVNTGIGAVFLLTALAVLVGSVPIMRAPLRHRLARSRCRAKPEKPSVRQRP